MLQTLNLSGPSDMTTLSDCNGADCAFACAAGCLVGCLVGGGSLVAFGALGGTLGGSGTAIAISPVEMAVS